MMMDSLVDQALAEARPVVFWLDRPDIPNRHRLCPIISRLTSWW